MERKEFELLYPQDILAHRIKELGLEISHDYEGLNPIMVGILKGCLIFMADLIRTVSIPVEVDFIYASSYNGGVTRDETVLVGRPKKSLTGRHIILVEGVVDSGHTAVETAKAIKEMEPASVEIVTLLDKPKSRKMAVNIKYRGFVTDDYFVIGFGLDKDQKYRNLPFIGRVIEP